MIIKGVGTEFKKEIMKGDVIKTLSKDKIPDQVVENIISDTEIEVKAPGVNFYEMEMEYEYKIIPKLD